MSKTIFCDIDGVIFRQTNGEFIMNAEILPGVIEAFRNWERFGDRIILTTGRRESLREVTEQQLLKAEIFYDLLIMGVGVGERILINDVGSRGQKKAFAINLERNEGLSSLKDNISCRL